MHLWVLVNLSTLKHPSDSELDVILFDSLEVTLTEPIYGTRLDALIASMCHFDLR